MNARILVLNPLTDLKMPRRMACRSAIPNHTSTTFIQEAWGEVDLESRVRLPPLAHVRVLVGGVVLHDQVQLDRLPSLGVEDLPVGPSRSPSTRFRTSGSGLGSPIARGGVVE